MKLTQLIENITFSIILSDFQNCRNKPFHLKLVDKHKQTPFLTAIHSHTTEEI